MRCDIETLSSDSVKYRTFLWKSHGENNYQKLTLFNFAKQPKTVIACKKLFLKQDILKEDYQKAFKKITLFFLLNPVPSNGQNYQKQKGSGTSDQSLLMLKNKFKIFFYLLYII